MSTTTAAAVRYRPDQNNFPNPDSTRRNNLFHYYKRRVYQEAVDEEHRPDFPPVCSLEFTNHCNLRCAFCARQVMTRERGFMEEALLRKMMEEFAERGTFVKLSGYGENLIHPQALDFIRLIKQTNPLYLTTNALLINEKVAECVVESDLDVLQFSLQGVDRESYEAQRRRGNFDRLIQNLDTLVRIRGDHPYPFIHVSTTILDETPEMIEPFIALAFEHGADAVGIGRTDYDRVVPEMITDAESKERIDSFRRRQSLTKVADHTYLYRYCDINWNGVALSSFFDFNEFLPVGNLNAQTMYEIWNHSPALCALRVLERRGVLNGVREITEALETLENLGRPGAINVFDTFYHAWHTGKGSYNT